MNDYETPQYVEDHRRPEEIEDDLERTRAEVSSTIDAIQSKLTPGQMMDQAFAYARTSLPAEFGTNLANTVRDNPVPVALMGVGIAWLMASGRHSSYTQPRSRRQAYDDDVDHSYSEPYADSGGMQGDKLHGAMEAVSEKGSEWRARAERKGRNALDKASDLGHRIGDKAASVTDRARNVGYQTRSRVNDISHRSQEQYYRAKDGVNRMVDEQPLMVGVMGLAAGALLGALLPSTRREDEMMGSTRDDLLDKAKEAASEHAERVKESAKHVAEVAKEEAKSVVADVAPGGGAGSGYATGASASSRPAPPLRTDSAAATNSGLAPGRQAAAAPKREEQYDEIPVDEAHM